MNCSKTSLLFWFMFRFEIKQTFVIVASSALSFLYLTCGKKKGDGGATQVYRFKSAVCHTFF